MNWDTIPGQSPPHVPTERITVLTGSKGKNLFERIQDPRIARVDASTAQAPDLIVFACGTDKHFDFMMSTTLPETVLAPLADGNVGVVFDGSTEGARHTPERTARLHSFLGRWRVPARRAVYLTQDRGYGDEYRLHCRSLGLGHEPMTILNHDYWIWRAFEPYGDDREEIYQQRLAAFRARPARRGRRHLSLNRTMRPHKTVFLLRILRDNLWDAGHVSFGGFRKPGDRIGKPRPSVEQLNDALPGFQDLIAELAPQLDVLEAKGQVLLGMQRHDWTQLEVTNAILAVDLAEYDDCWFSLVTETDFRARRFRITEKILKPFVNFHPMLVLGNPGALRMSRDFGFATFGDMFDESYDDETDQRRRFEHVYRQFVRLCQMDEADLARLDARVQDTLIFNARWGITRFPGLYRVRYDIALVNDMLAAVEGRYRKP